MNLEQIVTSLELSKKLEPYLNGYDPVCWWCYDSYHEKWVVALRIAEEYLDPSDKIVIALTAEECLELLPARLPSHKRLWGEFEVEIFNGRSIADALGTLLLYCFEEEIING